MGSLSLRQPLLQSRMPTQKDPHEPLISGLLCVYVCCFCMLTPLPPQTLLCVSPIESSISGALKPAPRLQKGISSLDPFVFSPNFFPFYNFLNDSPSGGYYGSTAVTFYTTLFVRLCDRWSDKNYKAAHTVFCTPEHLFTCFLDEWGGWIQSFTCLHVSVDFLAPLHTQNSPNQGGIFLELISQIEQCVWKLWCVDFGFFHLGNTFSDRGERRCSLNDFEPFLEWERRRILAQQPHYSPRRRENRWGLVSWLS